jgi:predicted DNA-binding transcriptional regulator YafY
MFSEEEMSAFMLGMKWVARFGDKSLSEASKKMIAKVERVVPETVLEAAAAMPHGVGEPAEETFNGEDLSDLRAAIKQERKLKMIYQKPGGDPAERIIWPIAIGYFPTGRVLVGWCETSKGFRHFRTDRIRSRTQMADGFPKRRSDLYREWQLGQSTR